MNISIECHRFLSLTRVLDNMLMLVAVIVTSWIFMECFHIWYAQWITYMNVILKRASSCISLWHTDSHRKGGKPLLIFFCVFSLVHGCQYRTVPAGPAGIYRTGQQSDTLDPSVSYRKKYRPYRPRTGRTGQFRAIPAGTEKCFFFFFFKVL